MLERAWLSRGLLSLVLLPLSWLYITAMAIRDWLHTAGWTASVRLPVKVVVVGNLIVGGAGKTPTVLAVIALLRQHGYTPGIVSRGYGRASNEVVEVDAGSHSDAVGDEPILLHRRAEAPVVVGADRVQAARVLLRVHPDVNIIVSDDGLQHTRLHRDADVIVFDERGIGNGRCLPAGPLRQRVTALPPPRSIVLYNGDTPSTPWPGHLGVRQLRPPTSLERWRRGEVSNLSDWDAWKGIDVIAAAGVARPERFFAMLRAAGAKVTPVPLPDHFDFHVLPWPTGGGTKVVVTEKDAVKLDAAQAGNACVYVAALDFALDDAFASALLKLIGPGPALQPRNA